MGSKMRAMPKASGSKARHMELIPKKRANGRNSSAVSLTAALVALILAIIIAYFLSLLSTPQPGLPPSLLPFPGPKLTSLPQFSGSYVSRMLWGTYRPGVYFGLRPRTPKSMIFGLMWLDPLRQDALTTIRHQAEMRDSLSKYGWLAHDGEGFGKQEILDEGLNITTSWVKNDKRKSDTSSGGDSGFSSGSSSTSSTTCAGGSWSARVSAQPRQQQDQETEYVDNNNDQQGSAISFFLYMATEDGSPIQLDSENLAPVLEKFDSTGVVMSGDTHAVGEWQLRLNLPSSAQLIPSLSSDGEEREEEHVDKKNVSENTELSPSIIETTFMGLRTPHLHNLTEAVQQGLIRSLYAQHDAGRGYRTLSLTNLVDPGSNVVVIQITAMLPTTIDISFTSTSRSTGRCTRCDSGGVVVGLELTTSLVAGEAAFNSRFERIFGSLTKKPTKGTLPVGTNAAARAALSNLLGGMGYWYGHSLVKYKNIKHNNKGKMKDGLEEVLLKLWDAPLYSATPSRSFFPRGFLWDEGFHQLLLQRWNTAMSRDAVAHWLDLMTASGWIPREQILGEEARARVPSEFIAQSPDAANPPALFLPLAEMAERVATQQAAQEQKQEESSATSWSRGSEYNDTSGKDKENIDDDDVQADIEFLRAAWPRLRTWFLWYKQTQAGPVAGSFRWRGREAKNKEKEELNPKTLTSGLDDYPRASHPSPEERHLDLRCWMALAAHSLARLSVAVGAPTDEIAEFRAFAAQLDDFEELKRLHWDEQREIFADWGLHTEDVKFVLEEHSNEDGNWGGDGRLKRVVNSPPKLQYVPHYGYLSLFPLIMNLIPKDSPILGQQIAKLQKESELWTPFGLRSLSKSSSLYNQYNTKDDPPYWRGPVWINVNYLVLRALRRYEQQGGPYAEHAGRTADDLRSALITNVVEQYSQRGYLYEQYDDENGNGKGCYPFTGWTALLTLIAGEDEKLL
ncbi:hypothetical protein Ndes2526B_g08146 [Nannochloris sp. 'desiccata']